MFKAFTHLAAAAEKGERLDIFLASFKPLDLSRSQIKKLISTGNITVNQAAVKSGYKLKVGDQVKIIVPPPPEPGTQAENIPLSIVYEDDAIIVVNKPKGLVTHPAPGHYSGTLVNGLLHHCRLASLGGPLRPGIVHRLDKDTSGLLVIAKTDQAYRSLVKQFKEKQVEKTYVALVHGTPATNSGVIDAPISRHPVNRKKMSVARVEGRPGTRDAYSAYRVMKRFNGYTLLAVKIKTGRTHQIRVHFTHLGHPLVGDQTYGKRKNDWGIVGQMLHAYKLSFIHPVTEKKMEFTAPWPEELQRIA